MKFLTIGISEEEDKISIEKYEIEELTEKEVNAIIGFLTLYQMQKKFQTEEAKEKAKKILEEVIGK